MVTHDSESAAIANRQLRLEHSRLHEVAKADAAPAVYRKA
jgi:hypothetical protein